jgi:hypothetical protein
VPADTPNRTSTAARAIYHFAEFEVRAESGEIFRNGERVRVQEQSLQVLLALLENPGGLISRDRLRERLWPQGTYVDFEHSLNAAVKRLRTALGDDADCPRYIETLPKRATVLWLMLQLPRYAAGKRGSRTRIIVTTDRGRGRFDHQTSLNILARTERHCHSGDTPDHDDNRHPSIFAPRWRPTFAL